MMAVASVLVWLAFQAAPSQAAPSGVTPAGAPVPPDVVAKIREATYVPSTATRSEAKDLWPGWWDLAVGGVVGAGETYDDAACRELAEEVGIIGIELQPLGGGRYVDDAVALIGRCYRVVHAGPFVFADGEVVEARWLSRPELGAALATTRFLPDSLALLLPLL